MNDQMFSFTQTEVEHERLDRFLVRCLPELSRARLQAIIRSGNVTLDGRVTEKMSTAVANGQQVQIILPPVEPSELIPESDSTRYHL